MPLSLPRTKLAGPVGDLGGEGRHPRLLGNRAREAIGGVEADRLVVPRSLGW